MAKNLIVKAFNSMLRPLGAEIVRSGSTTSVQTTSAPRHDPSSCYMQTDGLHEMLVDELVQVARNFFAQRLPEVVPQNFDFRAEVETFLKIYCRREHQDNAGGSGFHNSFWIFLTVRALKPELIIESGVWKGHTTRLLGEACPDATIHGFDIDLSKVEHRNARTHFHQQDWSTFDLGKVNPEKAVAFFDCHVNHARRIIEASARGFKHVLFDDDPPLHKLYSYGAPAFPTAKMLRTGIPTTLNEVNWIWHGKEVKCKIDRAEVERATKLMAQHETFPDVAGPTRFSANQYSFLSYVRINR
jgi:hypothetical protein